MNRKHCLPRQRGATRTDLLLGVGVLGLLLSVAGIPGTEGEKRVLEIAESRIRDALDLAAGLARSTQRAHGVAFDLEGERLAVIDADGRLAHDPLTGHESLVELGQGKLENAVDVTEADFGRGGRVVVFDARGLPLAGGRLRLVAGKEQRVLRVDPVTGFVDREPEPAAEPAHEGVDAPPAGGPSGPESAG